MIEKMKKQKAPCSTQNSRSLYMTHSVVAFITFRKSMSISGKKQNDKAFSDAPLNSGNVMKATIKYAVFEPVTYVISFSIFVISSLKTSMKYGEVGFED